MAMYDSIDLMNHYYGPLLFLFIFQMHHRIVSEKCLMIQIPNGVLHSLWFVLKRLKGVTFPNLSTLCLGQVHTDSS